MSSKIIKFEKNFFSESIRVIQKYSRIFLAVVLCAATLFSAEILKTSVNTFNIFDGKTVKSVHTVRGSIQAALNCVSLDSEDYKVLSAKKEGNVTDIVVEYVFPVYIVTAEKCVTVRTGKATVEEILGKAGYSVDEYDEVKPSADTEIIGEAFIYYTDVEYVKGSYTEVVPYEVDTVYSSKQAKGKNTLKEGVNGKNQVYYTTKLVDGKKVETVVTDTVVLSQAVNGKRIIGTKVQKTAKKAQAVKTSESVKTISRLTPSTPIELDKNGNPVNYKKKITTTATGYTYTGHKCSTGVSPKPGYIAVNPKIIPYGTKMYIKTANGSYIYGYAVAADTGGFAKRNPNNVDLFFSTRSACIAFGRRAVEIYFI